MDEIILKDGKLMLLRNSSQLAILPTYPHIENPVENAILLSMIDWSSNRILYERICSYFNADSKMTAAIALMPLYVKLYSKLTDMPYEVLKNKVYKLIAEARLSGML